MPPAEYPPPESSRAEPRRLVESASFSQDSVGVEDLWRRRIGRGIRGRRRTCRFPRPGIDARTVSQRKPRPRRRMRPGLGNWSLCGDASGHRYASEGRFRSPGPPRTRRRRLEREWRRCGVALTSPCGVDPPGWLRPDDGYRVGRRCRPARGRTAGRDVKCAHPGVLAPTDIGAPAIRPDRERWS